MYLVSDMKSITLRDIRQGYRGLKRIAQKSAKKGDFATAMNYIDYCGTVASQFNWIYADDELEELLDEIAKSKIDASFVGEYEADENHWVFFDDYCTSYVLALQWMNALSKTGKTILYVTSQFSFEGRRDISILPEIEKLPNVIVDVVPGGNYFERAIYLYRSIVNFRASKVILHKAMNSLVQLPLCVLPKEIAVYNINLGDQFFWLGVRHIDYNVEFRPFGASVSVQRRGFRKEQLLMVPFYPANENRTFAGFPAGCEGKLVIFSGGDFYKTFDESGTYWRLVKSILDNHKDIAFLFVTKNNAKGINVTNTIREFVKSNHFEDRFFCISFRHDIYQVFAHCDIYMGTCPVSGSLMSQLAAINCKPILQYYPPGTPDDETEQALCISEKFSISFNNVEAFLAEADMLISDETYRKKQGEKIKSSMMQPEKFNELVAETLSTNISQMSFELLRFDYDILDNRWHALEKVGFTDVGSYLYSLLGRVKCFEYAPSLYLKNRLKQIGLRLDRMAEKQQ